MKVRKFAHISTSNAVLILSFLLFTTFIVFCFFTTAAAESLPPPVNRQLFESELDELLTTVYCYCGCERETIEVCVCGTAEQIEADFRSRLLAGQTVEEIRTNYLDTYGPQFYAIMPAEGINLIAYITPAIILVLIGGVAFAVLRKAKQEPVATADRNGGADQRVSDTTLKQVEAELERYKQEK